MSTRGKPLFDAVSAPNLLFSPQGRLTLATGTPRMTASVSSATTIFYTPFVGALCPVWDPVNLLFVAAPFAEVNQSLSDTTKSPSAAAAGQIYDVFGWLDGTVFRATRGPAWSAGGGSATARGTGAGSTALTRIGGLLVNQYAITNGPAAGAGTWLGTFATDGGAATVSWIFGSAAAGGGPARFPVWNAFNRRRIATVVTDTTSNWTYATGAWRAINGSVNNSVIFVSGLPDDAVTASVMLRAALASSTGYQLGLATTIGAPNIGPMADLYTSAGTQYLSPCVPGTVTAQGLTTITPVEYATAGTPLLYGNADEALTVEGWF